jgi:hypothetical protein
MRFVIPIIVFVALCLGSAQAGAASCSAFAVIKSYNADASTVEVSFENGNQRKYFPKPEGTPKDSSKIPEECKRKVTRNTSFLVKPTGGRMSVTQVRSNFQGKMLNDTDDATWLPARLKQLIEDKTLVVIVIRPGVGKDAPLGVTTIYLPITEEELAEIKRLEDQAEEL